MLLIIPALALSFVSFMSSAFIILRIVVPILPPHPFSRRVSPAEFGLPTFRALSPADKSHLWLTGLDLVSLSIFLWQVVNESTSGPTGYTLATDPASAIRLWIVVTVRQTCLLMIAFITLLHVRMANPVSFGATQWMLWAPTLLLTITSTSVAGILSGSGVDTFFSGLTAYSSSIAVLTAIAFGFLIRTLLVIKKNLASLDEINDPWPSVRQIEDKSRPSFATEDIDAIKDGASWLTSEPGSRRQSMSAWSFSTHQTNTTNNSRPQSANHPSVSAKSSYRFAPNTPGDVQIPPVPPLPSPYGPAHLTQDPDPFRREVPNAKKCLKFRMGSQSSWLTSSDGSHTTAVTTWSFPTTHGAPNNSVADFHTAKDTVHDVQTTTLHDASRPVTPAGLSSAQVLGGYGYAPENTEAEKGMTSLASIDGALSGLSILPALAWSVTISIPLGFVLPYLIVLSQHNVPSTAVQILFTLSVTLSSPLLTFNLLTGVPLPIPVGLFDNDSLPTPQQMPVIGGSFPPTRWSIDYKRSTSTSPTIVEGRRSGDVWISKGDAVDGKGKFGRAMSLLNPTPKLSVLPLEENDSTDMPPIPFQNEDSFPVHVHGTPHSENSVQFGRFRTDSRGSSQSNNPADERVAFASQIMVAQRHYSALAQTVVLQGPTNTAGNRDSAGASTLVGASSGVASKRGSYASHLRTRSTSSANELRPPTPSEREKCISPPPSFPLPPTPPSVRAARLAMLAHKKSFSSGISLNQVDDINEIDAMTAGVLPILVPGLKMGRDMKIKGGHYSPPGTFSKSKGLKIAKKLNEFGEDFSSPEVHSTPARPRQPRLRKGSGHKKNHFSLPSLSLGKESLQSLSMWGQDMCNVIENKYTAISNSVDLRRNTVVGVETPANTAVTPLQSVREEEDKPGANLGRNMSLRSLGLKADVPHNVDSVRSSVDSLMNLAAPLDIPPSANSEATLFEDFEAGLQSGPQAESTPHNTITQKPVSRHPAPPMPVPEKRRSTVRYIKSDNTENQSYNYPLEESTSEQKPPVGHWSTRVRSVVPKASKLSRSPSDALSMKERGLRQLTLLQHRGNIVNNTDANGRSSPTAEIRPLTLGKKQKSRMRPLQLQSRQDENTHSGEPIPTTRKKNPKDLTLNRSETVKARGILRQNEVLPEVVVRPPSNSEHQAFAYSFDD